MIVFIVSIVEDVYDESEVPDIVDEVERRNEERKLRGKRERLPKRDEEGILIFICDVDMASNTE